MLVLLRSNVDLELLVNIFTINVCILINIIITIKFNCIFITTTTIIISSSSSIISIVLVLVLVLLRPNVFVDIGKHI